VLKLLAKIEENSATNDPKFG